jgi:hypothetical protein
MPFAVMEIQELKHSHSEKFTANVDTISTFKVGTLYLARFVITYPFLLPDL